MDPITCELLKPSKFYEFPEPSLPSWSLKPLSSRREFFEGGEKIPMEDGKIHLCPLEQITMGRNSRNLLVPEFRVMRTSPWDVTQIWFRGSSKGEVCCLVPPPPFLEATYIFWLLALSFLFKASTSNLALTPDRPCQTPLPFEGSCNHNGLILAHPVILLISRLTDRRLKFHL